MESFAPNLRGQFVLVAGILSAVVLGIAIGMVRIESLAFVVALAVIFIALFLSFSWPQILLAYLVLIGSMVGIGRESATFEVMGARVTIWGMIWLITMAILVVMIFLYGTRNKIQVPRSLWPFFALGGWIVFRWVTSSMGLSSFKEVILFLCPVLSALFLWNVLVQGKRDMVRWVAKLFLLSAFMPYVLYAILFLAGAVELTLQGPRSILQHRVASLYLVVMMCLGIAAVRYGQRLSESWLGLAVIVLAPALALFTLSRTAFFIALLLLLFSRIQPERYWRVAVGSVLAVFLAVVVLVATPSFRERLFHRSPTTIDEAVFYFNMSGRNNIWPLTYSRAMQKPLMGWGPEEARMYIGRELFQREGGFHTHNEYLQVFHDYGVIGLALFLAAWLSLLLRSWRLWREAEAASHRELAMWAMASVSGITTALAYGLVDNFFHYIYASTAILMFAMCAEYVKQGLQENRKPVVGRE